MTLLPGQLPQFGSDNALIGLKLWLPINEGAGSRFNNLIDSQNPGLMTGGAWSGGKPALDGTDDLVTLRRVPIVDFTTIIHYAPTGVSGNGIILDQGDIFIRQFDDDIIYGATDTLNIDYTDTLSAVLTAGEPIVIAVSRTGTTMTIWGFTKAGVATSSFTVSGTALTTNANLIVGSDSRTSFVFPALTPSNLTSEKGILTTASDNIEYSAGSRSLNSDKVKEAINAHQGTVEFWVRSSWGGGDGIEHQICFVQESGGSDWVVQLFHASTGFLALTIKDEGGTEETAFIDASSWVAGVWHHVVGTWSFNDVVDGSGGDEYVKVYWDGSNTSTNGTTQLVGGVPTPDAIRVGSFVGAIFNFNGAIMGRILSRPLTAAEVAANYAAGAGSLDTTVVDADTLWRDNFTESVTTIAYHHSGQSIDSIATVTLTTDDDVADRWADNDEVLGQDDDNPPNAVYSKIDGTPSGTTIVVDDSMAALTSTNKRISRNLIVDSDMELGNTGAYVAGDGGTTLSKSTTEIFKDTQSLKVLNGDGTQAFARQTITTVAGNDYHFFGRFFAPDTPNGASQLVDVDLTAALGITVTQANLSAGWNTVEFAFEAADTSTTIDLGSGSVTNTEFGYWDDVRVEANLVTQPGCEAADGNVLPTGWSDTGSPDADETQTDTADKHSGSSSILLNNCDADEGVTQDVTVVVDEYYTFSLWEKNNAQDVNVELSDAATATMDITGDNSWTKHSFSFKAATTTLTIKVVSGAADQSTWVDDFVVERNDTRAASAATRAREFANGDIGGVAIWDRSMEFAEVQQRKNEI